MGSPQQVFRPIGGPVEQMCTERATSLKSHETTPGVCNVAASDPPCAPGGGWKPAPSCMKYRNDLWDPQWDAVFPRCKCEVVGPPRVQAGQLIALCKAGQLWWRRLWLWKPGVHTGLCRAATDDPLACNEKRPLAGPCSSVASVT